MKSLRSRRGHIWKISPRRPLFDQTSQSIYLTVVAPIVACSYKSFACCICAAHTRKQPDGSTCHRTRRWNYAVFLVPSSYETRRISNFARLFGSETFERFGTSCSTNYFRDSDSEPRTVNTYARGTLQYFYETLEFREFSPTSRGANAADILLTTVKTLVRIHKHCGFTTRRTRSYTRRTLYTRGTRWVDEEGRVSFSSVRR